MDYSTLIKPNGRLDQGKLKIFKQVEKNISDLFEKCSIGDTVLEKYTA